MSWIEWFGYLASALIALSLMMGSIVKLRWLNLAGAAMFSSYGFVIGALPVAYLNGFIVLVNLYYLHGIYRRPDDFHLVEAKVTDPLVEYWLQYYRNEIQQHYPGLKTAALQDAACVLMLRNNEPVGVLLGQQDGETFDIALDYVFPSYQDFKTGHYLYRRSGYFSSRKVARITTRSGSKAHQDYLLRMGFERVPGTEDRYQLLTDTALTPS
jgi:hypothetical protein